MDGSGYGHDQKRLRLDPSQYPQFQHHHYAHQNQDPRVQGSGWEHGQAWARPQDPATHWAPDQRGTWDRPNPSPSWANGHPHQSRPPQEVNLLQEAVTRLAALSHRPSLIALASGFFRLGGQFVASVSIAVVSASVALLLTPSTCSRHGMHRDHLHTGRRLRAHVHHPFAPPSTA